MAEITRVSVDGLAGRSKRVAGHLNPDVNIFFGPNGSGKTGLLKILHGALDATPEFIATVRFETAVVTIKNADRLFKREFRWPAEIDNLDPDTRQRIISVMAHDRELVSRFKTGLPSLENGFGWREGDNDGSLRPLHSFSHRYLSISRLTTDAPTTTRGKQSASSEVELDTLFAESLQQLWRFYSNQILTEVRTAQESALARILSMVLASKSETTELPEIEPSIAYRRVQNFLNRQGQSAARSSSASAAVLRRAVPQNLRTFERFRQDYEEDQTLRSVVYLIDEAEQRIEEATKVRESLQTLVTSMVSNNKEIRFTDSEIQVLAKGGERIGLARLSSGEKQLLRILVETTMADGPVIIDEPELSMHIDWQRRLLSSMRAVNPTSQFIVATHSPDIMAHIDDEKIFRL